MDGQCLALLLVQWLILTCCVAMKPTNVATDQSALLALKAHISSDPYQILSSNWSSVSSSSSVCNWIGVQCDLRHRRVISLNISGMDLTGTIPPQLGNLSFLASLDMTNNYFHGNLPQELSRLRRLRFIRLDFNNFTGPVPTWFGLQSQVLSLSQNEFSGPIPSSISNMSKLKYLNFHHNFLTGKIPQEIGNLQSLRFLNLQSNQLLGSIPFSIFSISTLEIVGFTQNKLTGSLPLDICHNLPSFEGIHLSLNQLNGQIPSNLSHCSQLQILSLSYNNFSGFIPKELGNLKMLEELALGGNNLQGVIPWEIGSLHNLKMFAIESNSISVKVISSCSNQDFKALVLEYMPNRSLNKWLHFDHHSLNMLQRLEMMIDVSCALRYLHQEYLIPVIHCDLKPSNILIDEDMVANISDFGISKFLGKDESIALTETLATIGYIAPEYEREGLVSKACDVYSFGILLMEVFTGRRSNDKFFMKI